MLKNKRTLIMAVSLLLWMIFITAGYVSFEVNDDTFLNLLSAGAYGTGRQYFIFSNVILGGLLRGLFDVFPHINCYLWFYLVFNLIAVISVCLVITDHMKKRAALFTAVGINLLMAGDFYVHITFTKSATLYGTIGLVMLLWQVKKEKRDRGYMVLSFILIAVGMWARWTSFALCVPMVIGVELIEILFGAVTNKTKVSWKRYIPIFVAGIMCIASFFIDNLAYKTNAGWNEFKKTDNRLIEMRDYNRYVFTDSPEEFLAAGITENDFNMIKGYWMWNDPVYFSSERLQQIKDIGSKYEEPNVRFDIALVKGVVKEALWILTSKSFGIIFVIILLLGAIHGNKAMFMKLAYLSVVAVGEIYYMFCLNRVLWRVEVCAVLSAVLVGGYLISQVIVRKDEEKTEKHVYPYVIFATICIAFILVKSWVVDNSRYTNGDTRCEEFQNITQADGFFVVQDISKYGMLLGARDIFGITRANYEDFYSNVVELGGTSESPAGMYFARSHGITNPVKDLIDADGVYFVGDEEPRLALAEFMDEKYGSNLVWEQVSVDGVDAWKVSSGK
ncbi:hypothetical protein D6855_12340 [Butyrivibrio sp. CB08]|uniref:hypothetical protein n=1 Tax=Butyrivibrio sp. CB08 TaxID=2364879 RepID=UPI000EA86DBC|nr:hypothetical protein [Butyrivibrio sp. CB08]RKM57832.1 hypothetical protein D6855_12340 [Butyrivibrio sp. CB08]